MRLMKKDMGGAAHALALAKLVMAERLPVRLHLLIPAVENSVSAAAYPPGRRHRQPQGPEGRDRQYRRRRAADPRRCAGPRGEEKPELIIDFATLTAARGRPEDVINGFEAGADDYLPKPFELTIFLARLNGLLRRSEWTVRTGNDSDRADLPDVLTINKRIVDFSNLQLRSKDRTQDLTLMEAKLLRYLIENAGRPFPEKRS